MDLSSASLKQTLCTQDAGRKTPEKAQGCEFTEDFMAKSLVNTLFMMFNSRYQDMVRNSRTFVPIHPSEGLLRMYYILKAGSPYKHFAVRGLHTAGPVLFHCRTKREKRMLVVG